MQNRTVTVPALLRLGPQNEIAIVLDDFAKEIDPEIRNKPLMPRRPCLS